MLMELIMFTGERIFRIGNVCYKMDASRNSLIRISGFCYLFPAIFIFLLMFFCLMSAEFVLSTFCHA